MKQKENSVYVNVATFALTVIAVLHAWGVVTAVQNMDFNGPQEEYFGVASPPLMVIYMAAALTFNFCAANGNSSGYQIIAVLMSALHLLCGLLLGIFAASSDGIGHALALLAISINLPMGSVSVLSNPDSVLPWLAVGFYAVNLAVFYLARQQMERRQATQ